MSIEAKSFENSREKFFKLSCIPRSLHIWRRREPEQKDLAESAPEKTSLRGFTRLIDRGETLPRKLSRLQTRRPVRAAMEPGEAIWRATVTIMLLAACLIIAALLTSFSAYA